MICPRWSGRRILPIWNCIHFCTARPPLSGRQHSHSISIRAPPLTSFSAAALVFGCKQLLRGLACNPLLRHPVQKVLQLFVQLNTATTYEKTKAFNRLSFDSNTVLKRVERQGDLVAPVLALKQRLPDLNRLTSFQ